MESTADGNCLFHSASIALLGNEDISSTLRLFAVLHAVLHFEHYMTKVAFYLCSEVGFYKLGMHIIFTFPVYIFDH